MRKTSIPILTALVVCFWVLVAGSAFAEPKRVILGVGNLGGSSYVMGAALTKIWSQEVPEMSASIATGGSRTNLQKLGRKKIDFGVILNPDLADGIAGVGEWSEHQDVYKQLRTVFSWPGAAINVVVLESSGIKKLSDLKGKKICPGGAGTGISKIAPRVLAEFGVTSDNAKFSHYSARDAADQLKDGHIDAAIWTSFPPYAIVSDIALFRKIRLLGFEDDPAKNDRIAKMIGGQLYSIPPDVYGENQANEEPIRTLKYGISIVAPADFDEDIVYKSLKALFENIEEFHNVSNAAKRVTLEGSVNNLVIPLHEGAKRYYEEVGAL